MRISFSGQKNIVYTLKDGNQTLYTICDSSGKINKMVRHTRTPDGLKKKEILSPKGDVVEYMTRKNIWGKEVINSFDSKGRSKRTFIIENLNKEKNSLITDFYDDGKTVSRMLSIEKNPECVEVSEILYDKTGKLSASNYRIYKK